ncbi:MAG: carboxypeptidase-like regulatory domain-containing protein [Bacteroidota bacterium]
MKKLSVFLALISLAIFFIFSCQKDKTYQAGESNNLKTTVAGIVLDESNHPVNGVTVSGYGETTTTNQYGTFVLKNLFVNKNRCVLQFAKAGFFKRAQGFIPSGNTVNYLRIILLSNAATQNFSASAGGTISLTDGSSVDFQPNSFVTANGSAYTGTVNLIVKHLSHDDVNFGFMIPGGDLLGKDLNNKDVALYTYGMLGVELTGSSGEALQLANGTSATLTFSIAASQLASAPSNIPLWYFDETTSLWKEEGAANKVGNNYVGMVKHFSWWNCDLSAPIAYIKGKVVDCNGAALPNIVISLNGNGGVVTDQNGEFNERFITGATSGMELQVLSSNNNGVFSNSQIEIIPSLSPNQIYTVPDLVVSCATRVAGTVQTCDGQNISSLVIISNNSFFTYQYTTDNSFNLIVVPNSQLVLNAFYNNFNQHQIITSLSPPSVLNVGTVKLCDSISGFANSFTLDGGPFSNQLFNILPTTATGTVNYSSHEITIILNGNSGPYSINWFEIDFLGDTIGSSSVSYLGFDLINGFYYEISNTSNSNFVVTQIDSIGGRIKGYYTAICYMECITGCSNSSQGTISGFFDVVRTQ